MPNISGFTVTDAQEREIREALAVHQGIEVSEITLVEARRFMGNALQQIVMDYRHAQREAQSPVDNTPALS